MRMDHSRCPSVNEWMRAITACLPYSARLLSALPLRLFPLCAMHISGGSKIHRLNFKSSTEPGNFGMSLANRKMSDAGRRGVTTPCSPLQALCSLRHAPCSLRHALCAMLSALCAMRYALCALRHAPCSLRSAPCAMRHAPCAMRYALCAMLHALCAMHISECSF